MQDENSFKLANVSRLLSIMAQLRHPEHGCPWDVKQTMASLTRYTIEEAYEVADAIASGNAADIREELGDLLFQVVFYAQLADEEGLFHFDDVANTLCEKLIRRHPHVFGDETGAVLSDEDLSEQWARIKAEEKKGKEGQEREPSLLDAVPRGLPALMFAQKLQKACAKVGFDWPDTLPVLAKVREEVDEIQQEVEAPSPNQEAIEEEIGDALFAMVNLARHCQVDADTALRKASYKFIDRFNGVENAAAQQQKTLSALSLNEMEALWQQVKAASKGKG